jgi:hypothetical protein
LQYDLVKALPQLRSSKTNADPVGGNPANGIYLRALLKRRDFVRHCHSVFRRVSLIDGVPGKLAFAAKPT